MTNQNRITPIIRSLERLWREYPDLRLCQLIENIAGKDAFYLEDNQFLELLQQFRKQYTSVQNKWVCDKVERVILKE